LYSVSTWLAIAFSGLLSPSASATSLPTKKVSGFVGSVANRDGALNRGDFGDQTGMFEAPLPPHIIKVWPRGELKDGQSKIPRMPVG
jgi:hypothetical protein